MATKKQKVLKLEQLKEQVMDEWCCIGGSQEVLTSRFMHCMLEECAKVNGDADLLDQYKDRMYRSREVLAPAWLPAQLHKYWDWKSILTDVQWVYRGQNRLDTSMLQRICYHLGGRWDGDTYSEVILTSEVSTLFEKLRQEYGDRDDVFLIAAEFLCKMSNLTDGLPGALLYSVAWVTNAFLISQKCPPFVLWSSAVERFQQLTGSNPEYSTPDQWYREMEKFLLEQVHNSMDLYKSITA